MRLIGHVALVTGAQQGIGRAIAKSLADDGANVAINWLDDEAAAQQVAQAVRDAGRRAWLLQGDIAEIAVSTMLVEETMRVFGQLDILVNNAGIFPRTPFLEMTATEWDRVHRVNLRGAAFCAQAAARAMAAGQGGAIVNLASSAVRGSPNGAHYSASKSGLIGLTRTMALELAPYRIRVNAVAPGLVDTAQPRGGHDEEGLIRLAQQIPLARMGRGTEIGDAVVFLASDRSSFMTGEMIHVNGGAYMG